MDSPNLDDLESIERHLTSLPPPTAPPSLRSVVLTNVHNNLKAQRWDKRLTRVAVVLLAAGGALNAALVFRGGHAGGSQSLPESRAELITRAAVEVGEMTDAETAGRFAQHLAAMNGTTLSIEQQATIRNRIKSHWTNPAVQGKDG
jgi:hypothetical protein